MSWVQIHPSRYTYLAPEFEKQYFAKIKQSLVQKKQAWEIIYPPGSQIFAAFDASPLDRVKVVILGQDPYHGPGQANWLSFSVPQGMKIPPSLRNMYKEIIGDMWYTWDEDRFQSWDLMRRAEQWVLLLNSCLTVTAGHAGSHQDIWWMNFTDQVINIISTENKHVVFLLRWWFAKTKQWLIDDNKHLILTTSHPSPLSSYRWFLWCKHFSQTNKRLVQHGSLPVIR